MTWPQLLRRWDLIEADLADIGVDLDDTAFLRTRRWRWLRVRILGLLAADTRLHRALHANGKG